MFNEEEAQRLCDKLLDLYSLDLISFIQYRDFVYAVEQNTEYKS